MNKDINNFNSIARLYDVLCYMVFRNVLKKSQLHFIHQIPHEAHVLIVGGGTGWYLLELLKIIPCKKIVYVEASSEMISLSKKKIAGLSHYTPIEFIEGSIESIYLQEPFDVIVTNYVLDIFREEKLSAIMEKLYYSLKKDGLWMVTDFKITNNRYHKHWQKLLVKMMYRFFRSVSQIENDRLLSFSDFFKKLKVKNVHSKDFFSGMIESTVYKK